jgi:hypothetical protein
MLFMLWKNHPTEIDSVDFFGWSMLILVDSRERDMFGWLLNEKIFFGSAAIYLVIKIDDTWVSTVRGKMDRVANGIFVLDFFPAPKGDPTLVATTSNTNIEDFGAVFRNSKDIFQQGSWATPRQSVATGMFDHHPKPMSSLFLFLFWSNFWNSFWSYVKLFGLFAIGHLPQAHCVAGHLWLEWHILLRIGFSILCNFYEIDSLRGRSTVATWGYKSSDQVDAAQCSLLRHSVVRLPVLKDPSRSLGQRVDRDTACIAHFVLVFSLVGKAAVVDDDAREHNGSSGTHWGHERVSPDCSWGSHRTKDQTSALDHSGGRVSKARGRLEVSRCFALRVSISLARGNV